MRRTTMFPLSLILIASAVTTSAQQTTPAAAPAPVEHNIFNDVVDYLANRFVPDVVPPAATISKVEKDKLAASAVNQINQTRTDQQLGASPGAASSTSITEKAGVADLLSIAIERGAITKTSNGNAVTLGTTPYAWLVALGGVKDTNEGWQNHPFARKLAITSTFSSNDVTKGDFSSFSSGEVKYVFHGNRSARDILNVKNLPGAAALATAVDAADATLSQKCADVLFQQIPDSLDSAIIATSSVQDSSKRKAALDQVFSGYQPKALTIATIRTCKETIATQREIDEAAGKQLNKLIDAYMKDAKRFQVSLAGLFTRDQMLSDFYTVKFLADYNPAAGSNASTAAGTSAAGDATANPMWSANFDGSVDFNQRSYSLKDKTPIRQVRSYSIAFSANSPLFAQNLLDASLSAKGSRLKDQTAKSVVLFDGKLNVHLDKMFTLPIAVSYASSDTDTLKKGYQFNVGVSMLLDKLMSQMGKP